MKCIMKSFLFIALILLIGCDDFLTVLPDSSYSEKGGYQTQSDFEQAIAGVYAEQQRLYSETSFFGNIYLSNNRCDDVNLTLAGTQTYLGGAERFIDDDNNASLAKIYSSYYIIINRSNQILDKIDNVQFTDENKKKYIKGEALALRAYSYWNLGWQFGGVPLIKKVLTVAETKEIVRPTQQETFASAAEDFLSAASLLPAKWTGNNTGRVTKYAALGMLARMYLFQREFLKAKPILSEIIASGLYELETNYKDCFSESHENGLERVWEVQFMSGQLGEGQSFTSGCLPSDYSGTLQPFGGAVSAPIVSTDLMTAFEPGDLRKEISTVTNIKWFGVIDPINRFIRKFHYADVNTPKVSTDFGVNIPLLRYTDVKLMYAEVLNEESYSASGEAFNILNEVRGRAGLTALTSSAVSDKNKFREAIIKERRVEFAFEGLRWTDLIRWGIATTVMNNFLSDPAQDGGTYRMKEYQVLYAIPFDEINRYSDDKIMWQNPGY